VIRRRGSIATLAALAFVVCAAPAGATTFSNPTPITMHTQAPSSPYPSSIQVSGLQGDVTKVNVTLSGWTYALSGGVDVLLVGPGSQSTILLSGVCSPNVSGVTIRFDDAAPPLPGAGCTSGTFRPTNPTPGNEIFEAPAPSGLYPTRLSAFNTVAPNGTWSLYVRSDNNMTPAGGSFAGGWSLELTGPTTGQRAAALKKCKKRKKAKRRACRKKAGRLPV
jgi:hypothetical protein